MRIFSERYKELSEKNGRYPLLKIELYEGTRLNWTNTVVKTISGSDYIKSAAYTHGSTVKPNKFETGIAYCAKFTAILASEIYADIKYSQKIKVYTGFKDYENGTEEFIALGVFYVEEKDLRSEGTYISARDIMMYAETSWFPNNLTYPCTLTDVYKDVVRRIGGKVDENYTLPIEATVLEMPYMPSDPNVIYVHGTTELDGKPYTCRQVLAQIAKIQLGNTYADGDGYIKFYSYDTVGNVGDDTITEISIGDEFYSNLGVFYAYGDRTQEQVKGEETYGTIVFFTTLPIEDLNEGYYDQLREQAKKACGWGWKSGRVTRKGQGNAEPGDKIEYSGKYGSTRFFVSGIIMEWANGSFDETLYSFAPTYEDSAYSSNNTDSAPSEVENEASSGGNEDGGSLPSNLIIIDHEPTASDLTGKPSVIVRYDPDSVPVVKGDGTAIFSSLAIYVEDYIPTVTEVIVTPSELSVGGGEETTQQFTAEVIGTKNPSQAVTWSISGNADSGTAITEEGLLTISAGEISTAITVTATSVYDTSKSGTATVTIEQPPEEGVWFDNGNQCTEETGGWSAWLTVSGQSLGGVASIGDIISLGVNDGWDGYAQAISATAQPVDLTNIETIYIDLEVPSGNSSRYIDFGIGDEPINTESTSNSYNWNVDKTYVMGDTTGRFTYSADVSSYKGKYYLSFLADRGNYMNIYKVWGV